jgi:hypothetical protein
MATQLTPEQRKQRIETIVKILSVAGLCLILGPVYLTMLHGMEALVALGVFSAVADHQPHSRIRPSRWQLASQGAQGCRCREPH